MDISVVTRYDGELVDAVYELFPDIVEQGTSYDAVDNYINIRTDRWFRIESNGELIGFVQFKPFNRSTLEIHPFILPEMRKYSMEVGKAMMAWFDNDAPAMYQSVVTNIPSCKRYASVFARKLGFKKVGTFVKAFYSQNEYHDMIFYQRGRTRWVA